MSEVIKNQKHFLELSIEEKLQWRWDKVVNGYYLFALCINPERSSLKHIALFSVNNKRPEFIIYLTYDHLQDDGYLINIINKTFPC